MYESDSELIWVKWNPVARSRTTFVRCSTCSQNGTRSKSRSQGSLVEVGHLGTTAFLDLPPALLGPMMVVTSL